MSVIRWPEPLNGKMHLSEGEAARVRRKSTPSCRQVSPDYSLLVGEKWNICDENSRF